jgi:hypothetical protein
MMAAQFIIGGIQRNKAKQQQKKAMVMNMLANRGNLSPTVTKLLGSKQKKGLSSMLGTSAPGVIAELTGARAGSPNATALPTQSGLENSVSPTDLFGEDITDILDDDIVSELFGGIF